MRRPAVDDQVDVLVVGMGPTGMLLALLLARAGHRVDLVERHARAYPQPRAVSIDAHVARLLADVDVTGEGRWSVPGPDYVVRDTAGRPLLRVDLSPAGPGAPPPALSVHQPGLEADLEAALRREPGVTVRRATTVLEVRPGAGRDAPVQVLTRSATGPATRLARWVVGCDGARSTVARAVGPGVTDLGFTRDWVACDVLPHDVAAHPPVNDQVADPRRPYVRVSAGPRHRRWEFMLLPGEDLATMTRPASVARLLAGAGMPRHRGTVVRAAGYTISAQVRQRWRAGHVLLAGDAAHVMPPFAGQGMCTGLRDAADLAWKLDLVLLGRVPAGLLDSYASRRRRRALETVRLACELGALVCDDDDAARAARARLAATPATVAPALPGAAEELPVARFVDPGTGRPSPLPAGPLLLSRLSSRRFGLRPGGPATSLVDGVLADRPEREIEAVDPLVPAWFDRLGHGSVLLAPDRVLLGSASGPGASEALARAGADALLAGRLPDRVLR